MRVRDDDTPEALLAELAVGQPHAGEVLAEELGRARALAQDVDAGGGRALDLDLVALEADGVDLRAGGRVVVPSLEGGHQRLGLPGFCLHHDPGAEGVVEVEVGVVAGQSVQPPAAVQASFDEVNRAQQEREQMINQANGEYNKVVPRASGEAQKQLSEAEGYATKRVNEAEGDVARFRALLEQYEKAPEVTRQRLYLETIGEVLPQLGGKVILDADAKQFLPLMSLPAGLPQPPQPAVRKPQP